MPSRCVAAGCSNTSSESVSVYKFPKQETLLKQWTKQVQRTRANWVPTASSTLCSEHFEADYMGMHVRYKKVLKPNAIPTIFKRSLVGTSETETPSTSTGSSQYKKRKSRPFLSPPDSPPRDDGSKQVVINPTQPPPPPPPPRSAGMIDGRSLQKTPQPLVKEGEQVKGRRSDIIKTLLSSSSSISECKGLQITLTQE
uniref:THAP-type domain-containing protein n=1 Tax=Oryzias latipes TaxID=8090 RepID=A0A3B3HQY2_ORYLA